MDGRTVTRLCGRRLRAGLLPLVTTAQFRAEGGRANSLFGPKSSRLHLPRLLYAESIRALEYREKAPPPRSLGVSSGAEFIGEKKKEEKWC